MSATAYSTTPPKEVVEAAIVDTLAEMFRALQATAQEESRRLTFNQSFLASLVIAVVHLEDLWMLLEPVHPKTLSPRHRDARRLVAAATPKLRHYRDELLGPAADDNFLLMQAGNAFVQTLTSLHVIMTHNSTPAQRQHELDSWID
jgi:hypothetical protein